MPSIIKNNCLLFIVLGIFVVYTVATLKTTAPTSDELPHLASGYVTLKFNNKSLNIEHPPLVKILAAAPLLLRITPPAQWARKNWSTENEWEFGREFLYHNGTEALTTLNIARLPMLVFGVVLCLACYCWSYELFGKRGAVFSVFLCAFCPNILAHTRLITTDVPLASLGVLSAFLLFRFLRKSSFLAALSLGVSLGCMLSVKYSAIVLLGGMLVAGLMALFFVKQGIDQRLLKPLYTLRLLFIVSLAAGLVFSAVYGTLFFWPAYYQGLKSVGFNHNPDFLFYFLGNFKKGGFDWYFPGAFIFKSSRGLLLALCFLLVLGVFSLWKKKLEFSPTLRLFLLIGIFAPLSYFIFICMYAPNIGYRYIIPATSFLFVLCGGLPHILESYRWGRVFLVFIVVFHLQSAIRAFPDPISYFNGIAGCSGIKGIECLDDSNIDWGQNLMQLAKAVPEGQELTILYFGSAELDAYFSKWRLMQKPEMLKPEKTLYALSIHGLNRWNSLYSKPNGVDWFRDFKPKEIIGNTYYIYDFREPGPELAQEAFK